MPMFYFFKGALGFNTYTGLILGYLLVNATFYINVIKCDRKKQKKKNPTENRDRHLRGKSKM